MPLLSWFYFQELINNANALNVLPKFKSQNVFYLFLVPAKMHNTPSSCFPSTKSSACRSACEESREHGLAFLYMDQKEWFTDGMQEKVYSDPVQVGVRIVISRALVNTFDLFTYEMNRHTELPLCQETLIHEVIDYVMKQAANVMYRW